MKKFLRDYSFINTWSFFWTYVIYSILSSTLFIYTTGGGFGLISSVMVCFLGFGILFVIILFGVIRKVSASILEVGLFKNVLYFILLPCQLVLLFLNTGDCGDSPCQIGYDTNFLRRLFFPDISPIRTYPIYDFLILFQLLYIFTLCFVFLSPLFSKKNDVLTS